MHFYRNSELTIVRDTCESEEFQSDMHFYRSSELTIVHDACESEEFQSDMHFLLQFNV